MPIINVRTNANVTDTDREKLTSHLVESTCRTLKKDKDLVLVNCVTGELSGHWSVAGQAIPSEQYVVDMTITVTAGTNSLEEKSAWIRESFESVVQVLGRPLSPCYVAVHEIPDQAWGFDGLTQLGRKKLVTE